MNILHIVTTISILAILYLVLKLTRKVHTMERSQNNIDLTDNNMSKKKFIHNRGMTTMIAIHTATEDLVIVPLQLNRPDTVKEQLHLVV